MTTTSDNRYSNGKIYRIVCDETDDEYIGSSCLPLYKRLHNHKGHYKAWKKGTYKNYMTSYEILKHESAKIFLVESFPCASKEELLARERYYIENRKCVNKYIPGRTKREYYADNREHKIEYKKERYAANREHYLEYAKEWYIAHREEKREKQNEKFNCECGGKYTDCHKARHMKTRKHTEWAGAQRTTSQSVSPSTVVG